MITFLLDANMPKDSAAVVQAAGHLPVFLRDVGLRSAPDTTIAAFARANAMAIITRDFDFADVRLFPPNQFAGIVVLQVPDSAGTPMICALMRDFFGQSEVIALLPGHLAIVEFGRVRLRSQ
jgi:predicted nuclease of predicted toxin-antitoxin system